MSQYGPPGGGYPPQQPGGYPGQPGGYPSQGGGYPGQPGGYGGIPGGTPELAGWGSRFGAYLIDGLLCGIPAIIGGIIGGVAGGMAASSGDPDSAGTGALIASCFAFLMYLVTLGLLIYNRWIQGGKTGQTWGRKFLNIKLVGEQTQQPIGAGMAFVRDLCHMADSFACYIGWLWPLWDEKNQTFADKIIKTLVVKS